MKKIFSIISFIYIISSNVYAQDVPIFNEENGEVLVEEINVEELEKLFTQVEYTDYKYIPGKYYPAIFLQKLPADFANIEDIDYRNNLFIRILAPIAIKVNEDIFEKRKQLFAMYDEFKKTKELNDEQTAKLEKWAEEYDVFTRLKGHRRTSYLFDELINKLDVIPPSMLIGSAIIESNWGTSRPAVLANSLYKEKVWYGEEEGLQSSDDEDDDYEFKAFNSLYDAMISYALKINSGIDFYYMRDFRFQYRRRHMTISGRDMAHAMMLSSELKNYAGILDYTITFYNIGSIDYASLMRLPK